MQDKVESRSDNKLSFICYNNNTPPQFFKINKQLIRLFIFTPGIFAIATTAALVLMILYFNEVKSSFKTTTTSQQQQQIEETNNNLTKEIESKDSFIKELQLKLSSTSSTTTTTTVLSSAIFATPQGQKDLSSTNAISLTDISVTVSENSYVATFNVLNNDQSGQKASGHIFVVLSTPSLIEVYPPNGLDTDTHQTNFAKGEPFWIMRTRPVKALFTLLDKQEESSVRITAILFSRTGDLLLKQQIYPKNKDDV